MGFLGKLVSSAIQLAITPVAVVGDVLTGFEENLTGKTLRSAANTFVDGVEDLEQGDLL